MKQKSFFDELARKNGFHPTKEPHKWYSITIPKVQYAIHGLTIQNLILIIQDANGILNVYSLSLFKALKAVYPQIDLQVEPLKRAQRLLQGVVKVLFNPTKYKVHFSLLSKIWCTAIT